MRRGFHEASAGGRGAAVWYESCSCLSPGQSYLQRKPPEAAGSLQLGLRAPAF